MKAIKAVITADIVNSSLLGKDAWNSLLKSLERFFKKNALTFGFYRGDSFYTLCEVNEALRYSCLLRTLAIPISGKNEKGIDIRIAIGIGKLDEPVKDPTTAKGEAFVLSGRQMDAMPKEGPRLSIRCTHEMANAGLAATAFFTDFLMTRLTIPQAEVIHLLLLGITQTEASRKLGKSQSTVSKHAAAANLNELEKIFEIYDRIAALLVDPE